MGLSRGGRDAPHVRVGVFAVARVKTRRLLPRDRSRRKELRAERVQRWEASLVVELGRRRRRGPVPIESVAVLRRQQPVLASLLARDAVALARDAPPSVADGSRHAEPLAPVAVLVGPSGLGDRLDARARDAPRLGGVLEVRRVAVGTAGSAVAVRVAAAGVPNLGLGTTLAVVCSRRLVPRELAAAGAARGLERAGHGALHPPNSSRISPPPPRNMADETPGRPHAAKLQEHRCPLSTSAVSCVSRHVSRRCRCRSQASIPSARTPVGARGAPTG